MFSFDWDGITGFLTNNAPTFLTGGAAGAAGTYLWVRTKRKAAEFWTDRGKGTHFTMLVAKLDDDENGKQTKRIINALRREFPRTEDGPMVHIIPYPEVLVRKTLKEVDAADRAAQAKGRKWLRRKKADLLIWGGVDAADKVLRLRFLPREGGAGGDAKPYALNDVLELPQDFGTDLGTVLAVSAAVGIRPVYDDAGHALAAIIEPVVKKLAPLAANPPASFSGDTKARIWHAYAVGEMQLGEERGDNARLETAIACYRKTLTEWTCERSAGDRAMTQNNLGIALSMLGKRESGTARLEEAVAAYRAALAVRTRERVPLDWAMTQNNLGNALHALGERESGTARLEEAASAYRAALKEHTRERVPLAWAGTQNNLGLALRALDECESGRSRLEEAVAAYRAALKEYTRERVPLAWAKTQNNVGLVLATLGERESGMANLEDTMVACRAALEEYTRELAPLQWAATQDSLGVALRTLGQRQAERNKSQGCAMLKKARVAFAGAIEEFVRGGASDDEKETRNNLDRLEQAVVKLGCGR